MVDMVETSVRLGIVATVSTLGSSVQVGNNLSV